MTKVLVGEEMLIRARNPWARVGMSDKTYYYRHPQPWVVDPDRASAAQKHIWELFTAAVLESISKYPADGSFATLQARVKYIGSLLKGVKGAETVEGTKYLEYLPISAKETHPKVVFLKKVYGVEAPKSKKTRGKYVSVVKERLEELKKELKIPA